MSTKRTSAPCHAGRTLRTALLLATVATWSTVTTPSACVDPPVLSAVREGDTIRLSWTGTLEAGEQWALHAEPIEVLAVDGWSPGTPIFTGTGEVYVDAVPTANLYRVRCEGPGGDGPWSNMGFRVEYEMTWSEPRAVLPLGAPDTSYHFLSLPSRPGFEDVGLGGSSGLPCSEPPDGMQTADDAICALWSGRGAVLDGRFTIRGFEPTELEARARHALRTPATGDVTWGTPFDLAEHAADGHGIMVQLTGESVNPVWLVGAHVPDQVGYLVTPSTIRTIMSVPYHVKARTLTELLCGVEGEDWVDMDSDGDPDTCPSGIFGGSSETSLATLTTWFDDEQRWFSATVSRDFIGRLTFTGSGFALVPGEAYLVTTASVPEHRVVFAHY